VNGIVAKCGPTECGKTPPPSQVVAYIYHVWVLSGLHCCGFEIAINLKLLYVFVVVRESMSEDKNYLIVYIFQIRIRCIHKI
jgi:hypothetical protein